MLRDVTAAFHKFPYEFQRLRGQVSFDDNAIRIERIQGIAAGGATVGASGIISPVSDNAGVDISVRVEKLPIDERLAVAMKHRAKALIEVFSQERLRELLDRGLLITPARRNELLATLAGLRAAGKGDTPEASVLERESATPAFDVGGKVNVDVRVFRKAGPGSDWDDEVKIDLMDVGVLWGLSGSQYPCED